MNIKDLENLSYSEQAAVLQSANENQINELTPKYIEQFNGLHDILKKQNKATKTGVTILEKLVFNFQRKIVYLTTSFLFGKPISLVLNNITPETLETFTQFKVHWNKAKTDTFLYQIAEKLLVQTRVALETLKDIDGVRHLIIDSLNSESFYVNFNDEGKMDSFLRNAKIKTFDANENKLKEVAITEFITDTKRVVFETKDDNNLIKEEKIDNKIPVVYAQIESADFSIVQNLIDRFEKSLSKLADSNDYFSDPKLIVNGRLSNNSLKKDSSGDVIELTENGEAKYLTWERAAESVKMEFDILIQNIHSLSSTPEIELNNLKTLSNVSGIALKLLFLDATLKRNRYIQTVFNEFVVRLISVMKNQLSALAGQPDFNSLDIKPVFSDFLPSSEAELISTLGSAVSYNILSRETAIENNPFAVNTQKELENIAAENIQTGESFTV